MAAGLLLGQSGATSDIVPAQGFRQPYGGYGPGQTLDQPSSSRSWGWRSERPLFPRLHSWFGRGSSSSNQPNGQNMSIPQGQYGRYGQPNGMSQPDRYSQFEQFTPPITNVPAGSNPRTRYIYPTSNPRPLPTPITTEPPLGVPTSPSDFPRRMPNPQSRVEKGEPAIASAVSAQPVKGSRVEVNPATFRKANEKSPILPALANKIGRDEKFEWITGQLEVENGGFVIYYATPETVDTYHGRVALQTQTDMSKFRRGDLISVRGQLVHRGGRIGRDGPVYRVTAADLIERPR